MPYRLNPIGNVEMAPSHFYITTYTRYLDTPDAWQRGRYGVALVTTIVLIFSGRGEEFLRFRDLQQ